VNLNTGDVAELKSGGPAMTVEGRQVQGGALFCVWFDGKTRESALFKPETLRLVDSKSAA
jgi:uncharacterized protein YodC (DUF2158 family)